MMLKPPQWFTRFQRSGYLPVVASCTSAGLLVGAGGLAMHTGPLWLAAIDFWVAGIGSASAFWIMLTPLRIEQITELQRAEMERDARAAIERAFSEAKESGLIPPNADIRIVH